jgi:hypothetical protein
MMRRPLMLAAFTAVAAATVLTRAQGPAGTGAECQPCAVEVGEFVLPPQVEQVSALAHRDNHRPVPLADRLAGAWAV